MQLKGNCELCGKQGIKVLWCECGFKACRQCVKTIIFEQSDPHCSTCDGRWSRMLLHETMGRKFMMTEYKKYREDVLYDRQTDVKEYMSNCSRLEDLKTQLVELRILFKCLFPEMATDPLMRSLVVEKRDNTQRLIVELEGVYTKLEAELKEARVTLTNRHSHVTLNRKPCNSKKESLRQDMNTGALGASTIDAALERIECVDLRRFGVSCCNGDLVCKYIKGVMTKDSFKNNLQRREKSNEKNDAIRAALSELTKKVRKSESGDILTLKESCNTSLERISKVYNCKRWWVDNELRLRT